MARLILEEGGKRRIFKLNEGRLTVGSAAEATLRLTSPDVAEVHVEVAFEGGRATVRPRPGVTPPLIAGQPVTESTPLPPGCELRVGSAVLRIELAGDPAGAPGRAGGGGRPARAPRTPAAPRGGGAPSKRVGARGRTGSVARVQPRRPVHQVKRGIPTWAMLSITALAVVVLLFALKAGLLQRLGKTTFDPAISYQKAVQFVDERAFERALAELSHIDPEEAPPAVLAKADELKRRIAEFKRQAEIDEENRRGTEWKATQLERFVDQRLAGDNPPPERVRVFLKRCREFRERWPNHPEMDWVDRYERRYAQLVDLSKPPTFTDLEYEVKTLTWAKPRNYIKAFALIEEFRQNASPEDRVAALALEDKLRAEQAEYFADRMQQAKWHWERNEGPKAVAWLVELIIGVDDPELVDQAADELVHLPGIEGWMRGYKEDKPEKFERLVQNDRVRELARSLDLVP